MTAYVDSEKFSPNTMLSSTWTQNDWKIWFLLMVVAVILRVVFYTGYMGSDEVTYTESAFQLLHGDWSVSIYPGSNRYGVNLPVAAFAYLFGQNEFAANLYSLLCSLGEIALVFYFGRLMLGLRAAVLATTILTFLPLHVHFAGRLMADSPLALMITASFLFFWDGERKNSAVSFLVAGLAAGLSFWIKTGPTIIYLMIFLAYPIFFRRWNWKWSWMLVGFTLVITSNMMFFWKLTGDPLFLFQAMQSRMDSGYLEAGSIDQSPVYYLVYLFIKIWHTWLVFYLAVTAVLIWMIRRHHLSQQENDALLFLGWWAGGLLIIFSLFVVSWNPLIFVPKQTNYMLMFVAPLALLAGYALACLRGIILWMAVGIVVLPSTMLVAMEQNTIDVFTANSKAAVEFARQHKGAEVFSNTNAFRAAIFYNLVNPKVAAITIWSVDELLDSGNEGDATRHASSPKYAIMDTETLSWGTTEPIRDINAVPPCWVQIGVLEPSGFGLGWRMLNALRVVGRLLPVAAQAHVTRSLDKLTQPEPAYVYEVPEKGCD